MGVISTIGKDGVGVVVVVDVVVVGVVVVVVDVVVVGVVVVDVVVVVVVVVVVDVVVKYSPITCTSQSSKGSLVGKVNLT